jgi:antitoxin ParD1/3/4
MPGSWSAGAIGYLSTRMNAFMNLRKSKGGILMAEQMATRQVRLPRQQVRALECLVNKGIYPTISEAIRDAVRQLVEKKGGRKR